ncbi:MAG: glutamate formimidoyltransferase [Bacteroidia bacterium]|nr:glutamate formimidoyltransferase [Bacteroidia bacterium]
MKIIECVPNFSEGNHPDIIRSITEAIESVEGVKLLNTDPGKATNRTVVTFVGEPEPVIEAAFRGIRRASELIDMSRHKGEHPRMGATDVCPLIPVSGISMEETAGYAQKLAERVGKELQIPVYLYEAAQKNPARKNLSVIRAGEYEGFFLKIKQPEWKPDFGPTELPPRSGATVIGARDFLVAYNVNLNTTSVRRANSVAFDVRENGRKVKNEKGEEVVQPGTCKSVKAIGWYIKEYGIAQVSMNLTDISVTPLHKAFDECVTSAFKRGMRVTGSELVGLVPLRCLTEAGKYFLNKQRRSSGVSESELIRIAIRSLGLGELAPFIPEERIIEYRMKDKDGTSLVNMTLTEFADEAASESPAPGGGSVSAYTGALGVSLGVMVANLSSHKKGWDDRWEEFSSWAEKGQVIKEELLRLVDDDTAAFNKIMDALGLPKSTQAEKTVRTQALEAATRTAIEVPFRVMKVCTGAFELILQMVEKGNPNSASDAGVGALCVKTAIAGAFLNVQTNCTGLKDKVFRDSVLKEAEDIYRSACEQEEAILNLARARMI